MAVKAAVAAVQRAAILFNRPDSKVTSSTPPIHPSFESEWSPGSTPLYLLQIGSIGTELALSQYQADTRPAMQPLTASKTSMTFTSASLRRKQLLAHVDLAGDRGGNQSTAAFIQQRNRAFRFA